MNVALVHKRFDRMGGTERYLVGLATGLLRRGHRVDLYCATWDPALTAGLTVHKAARWRGGGALAGWSFWISSRRLLSRASHDVVVALGRTLPADVVRTGGGCHAAWYESLLAAARGLPRLYLRWNPYHRFTLWMERRQFGPLGALRIVAVSHLAAEEIRTHHPGAADRIRVVWNGVDLQRFHPRLRREAFAGLRRQFALEPADSVVLFVGNGWRRKGLDVVMRAVAELADPAIRLVVVGQERQPGPFVHLAGELGLRHHVVFAGATTAVERFYAAADVLVLPSRYDAFANVCLEALATGLPVVTSARNGSSEVLAACRAARVVDDPEDHRAVAGALRALLATADRGDLSAWARATAEQHGLDRAVDEMSGVLEECASGPRHRP